MAFFARPSSRSAAVKIVAPTAEFPFEQLLPRSTAQKKDTTQRQCRNIMIYGSCKFEGKGCHYYHPPRLDPAQSPSEPESIEDSAASTNVLSTAINAPVFVPKSVPTSSSPPTTSSTPPLSSSTPSIDYIEHEQYNPYAYMEENGEILQDPNVDGIDSQMQSLGMDGYGENYTHMDDPQMMMQQSYTNGHHPMDVYYQPAEPTFVRQPLHYHLYSQPLPHIPDTTFFISDDLREELQRRSEATFASPAPGLSLPEELHGYHTLVPLEPVAGERRKFISWHCTVYRATKTSDGKPYSLRRMENYRLTQPAAFKPIEIWSRIRHPNIVSVREGFTSRAFGDHSLVLVYDYHPTAQTVYDAHIKPRPPTFRNGRVQHPMHIPENTVWTYVVQIANAIKAVHDANLAVRTIDATKILITSQNRVRISACAMIDVLTYENISDMATLQQEDLTSLGRLIFAMCCKNMAAATQFLKYRETMSRHYSADLLSVASWLISATPNKMVGHLFDMIGSRLLTEMDAMQLSNDQLEGALMKELENARLVRLLCKFGFINERPEFDREPRWSETGDRYIIKLFRDYVFHQVDEQGNPVVNLSHVLTCLNKLDVGTDERIMLVSRDEQSCLVVSYKEVKACIEGAFGDLARGAPR